MSNNTNEIIVVEVPTEAGTHWYGQSKAPKALQDAGLLPKLQRLGYSTQVISALPEAQIWQPAPLGKNGVRGEEACITCMKSLQDTLSEQLAKSKVTQNEKLPFFPIIIGGPCAITPAIMSAISAYIGTTSTNGKHRLGLLMIDSDADLTLPSETSSLGSTAILDSMTLTHLTRRPGGLESMKQFGTKEGKPLITADNFVLFGLDVTQPKPAHYAYLLDNNFRVLTNHIVQENPIGSMKEALKYLDARCESVLMHLDVDVVDSAEWPLGNFPSYGGLSFDTVIQAVQLALAHEKVIGLVVAEVNPNNDPTGAMVSQLVDGLMAGFSMRQNKRDNSTN